MYHETSKAQQVSPGAAIARKRSSSGYQSRGYERMSVIAPHTSPAGSDHHRTGAAEGTVMTSTVVNRTGATDRMVILRHVFRCLITAEFFKARLGGWAG
jgi:hypothetical protein